MFRPLVVLGTPDRTIPIWELGPLEVMVNAVTWRWGRPPVPRLWVDSGGYQIMVRGKRVGFEELLRRYRALDGDVYMSLDEPPRVPGKASPELVMGNVQRFERMYTLLDDKIVVPVIHCYPLDLFYKALEIYESYGVKIVAFGGAVPPTMGRCGPGSRLVPVAMLALLRKVFRGWIHALGIGGTCSTLAIMSALKVDSFDSSSWRVKAAYGKIIVPGLGERYVGDGRARFGRKDLSEEEYEELRKFLERTGFPMVDKLRELLRTFQGRALVNAWVVTHVDPAISPRNGLRWLYGFACRLDEMGIDEVEKLVEKLLSGVNVSTKTLR